jgi:multiple sugar transport system permease protein
VEHRLVVGEQLILFQGVGLVWVALDGSSAASLVATRTPLGLLHRGVRCLAWSFQQALHESSGRPCVRPGRSYQSMQSVATEKTLKRVPTKRMSPLRRRQSAGILFVLPSVIFITLFFIIPLLLTVWMSLNNWPLLGTPRFIGLGNYQHLVTDTVFLNALLFTTKYTILITPIIFLIAFGLAVLVRQSVPGVGIFRTAYFVPVIIGLSTASYIWIWMFNNQVGIFDGILRFFGIPPIVWLSTGTGALFAVIVMIVWKTSGFTMVLLMMGLQSIPTELYEAVRTDGANRWQELWNITLPLMRRSFALALVLSVIGSYLAFDQFYIMTQGGPQNQTITIVFWIFTNSFTFFKLGYGAAMSIILLIILLIISAIQLYLLRDNT